MEVSGLWVPSEMIELITQDMSSKTFAAFSMCSTMVYKEVMTNPRFIQANDVRSERIVHKILTEDSHVFLTGAAGTGKSYTLRKLYERAKEKRIKIAMTASTGLAATNLPGGQTLHSFAGIPVNSWKPPGNRRYIGKKDLQYLRLLVIDEVSMLDEKTVETLCEYLRARQSSLDTAGGVKIVFCGDFHQLGPIKSRILFQTKIWTRLDPLIIEMTQNVRQLSDRKWFKILNELRVGDISLDSFEMLSNRYKEVSEDRLLKGEFGPIILSKNRMCDSYNKRAFKMNPNDIDMSIDASDTLVEVNEKTGETHLSGAMTLQQAKHKVKTLLHRTPERLELKQDALYVLTYNLETKRGEVNGLVCRYEETDRKMHPLSYTNVDGEKVEKLPISLNKELFHFKVAKNLYYVRQQYPFRLAHALTIHSSQGMTLQRAAIDCGLSIFGDGQMYTSLSRLESLQGLTLIDLDPCSMKTNRAVLTYYRSMQNCSRYCTY